MNVDKKGTDWEVESPRPTHQSSPTSWERLREDD